MNFRLFRRHEPDTASAARTMALAGVERRRAKIRATVDDMRARMGMPKAEWPGGQTQ